jgi:F0F1-type ATP synthase membrane subunit b/b'
MWIFGFALMQVIVFGVVLYFYKKITTGDTENTVKRLGAVYEDLLKKQKDLTEKLESAEKEYQAKKEESALIADKLAGQAMDDAHKKEGEILKKARAEAEDILSKAHASRDQFAKEMEIAAGKKMVDFTADLLKHVYDDKVRLLIHGQFLKNFMAQAQKSDLASVDLQGQRPTIRTAIPLTKEEQELLCQVLARGLGSPDLRIDEAVDESLIAGVAMQIGTLILDGSFANAIKEAASQVKEKMQT